VEIRAEPLEFGHLARDLDFCKEDRPGNSGGQTTIPSQQATAFGPGPLDDLRVGAPRDVGRVVPHHPEVPGQAPQHPVGEKPGRVPGDLRRFGRVVSPPFI